MSGSPQLDQKAMKACLRVDVGCNMSLLGFTLVLHILCTVCFLIYHLIGSKHRKCAEALGSPGNTSRGVGKKRTSAYIYMLQMQAQDM